MGIAVDEGAVLVNEGRRDHAIECVEQAVVETPGSRRQTVTERVGESRIALAALDAPAPRKRDDG